MVLNPVVILVMRLFAPPSMADDRIAQTYETPANDLVRTSRPVEPGLAITWRKWDKDNRTAWEALSLSRIFDGYVPGKRAFLLPA